MTSANGRLVAPLEMCMSKPVMGDQTPRTAKAVDDAWRLPTNDHRLGYMISFAQGLELELAAALEYGHKHRLEAALAKRETSCQPQPCAAKENK
jgi:hypothetical protein